MQRPLGAQISHMLKDRGVEVIFGIPGVHNQEMYRGIEEAGLTHVLARHEQGAGFMADGYARATGMPGVAYVITGPGVCNIMTPMGQAYSDSVPLLVISSCLDETAATHGQLHQMIDQRAAAEAVCDWSLEARTAEAAYTLIDRAFMEFHAQRKRPKHIQVPIAVLEAIASSSFASRHTEIPDSVSEAFTWSGFFEAASEPMHSYYLEQLATRLLCSEKPLFVFGGGCGGCGRAVLQKKTVRDVLRLSKAAAFTTYAGRGVVPADWPLLFGSTLARPDSADILASSDVVVFVGTDQAEVDLWRPEAGHRPGHAFHINIDPQVLSRAHPKDHCLQYDALTAISHLGEKLEAQLESDKELSKSVWSADVVSGVRDRWRAEVDAERPGIVPICDALRDVVPEDAMIYSDMTQFAYVAKEVWDMRFPGHWHHPYGFGTLGYATPAAIGGAIARQKLPTMAIIGDYGFQYTMQELGVAVELGLTLPIILWDNGKLKEIEDSMVRAQIAPNAVVARNPDFCKLAEAYGAGFAAPRSLEALQDAVREAFTAEGPTLIHVTPDISS